MSIIFPVEGGQCADFGRLGQLQTARREVPFRGFGGVLEKALGSGVEVSLPAPVNSARKPLMLVFAGGMKTSAEGSELTVFLFRPGGFSVVEDHRLAGGLRLGG